MPSHRTTTLDLTHEEVQTLTCAMAGNFPDSLNEYRWELLRKLAKAHFQLKLREPHDATPATREQR